MTKLFAAIVLLGFGATTAFAVAPCAQVCTGRNEPCSLRCYLDNHFVTTCDQVYGGRCVRFGVTDDAEVVPAPLVCDAELELDAAAAAWVDTGIAAAGNLVSLVVSVLGSNARG